MEFLKKMNGLQKIGIGAIVFGIFLFIFPEFVGYLLGAASLFLGINMLAFSKQFSGKFQKGNNPQESKEYYQVGDYKIFR